MTKFTHYLITRYNVPVPAWEADKHGQSTHDIAWLTHRENLFKTYCLPTVKGQTQKNFIWLLYFDINTPETNIERLLSELEGLHVEIRRVKDFPSCLNDLKNILSSSPASYVITSRLDNDDGLANNFIDQVQKAFVPQDKTIITFGRGVIYDIHQHIVTASSRFWNNHFTSLIELKNHGSDPLTIIGFPHDMPPALSQIRIPSTGWIKIIHERNIKSRLYGKPLLRFGEAAHFNIHRQSLLVSPGNTIRYAVKKAIGHFIMNVVNIIKR